MTNTGGYGPGPDNGQPGYGGYGYGPGQPGYGQGVPQASLVYGYPPATTGRRIGAFFLDLLFCGIISNVVSLPLRFHDSGSSGTVSLGVLAATSAVSFLLSLVVWVAYYVAPTALKGTTLGKMCLGLHVLREDNGQVPGWGKAFLREVVLYVMELPCYIPAIINSFTMGSAPFNKGWHDSAAGTVVVRRS